jgi:hypothetical protein
MRRAFVLSCVIATAATVAGATAAWPRSAGGVWLQVRDGTRVKTRDSETVYLADQGVLRPITYDAYVKLWKGWGGIIEVIDVPTALVGARLEPGARLVKSKDDVAVWLVDAGSTKRVILDPTTFNAYGFSWGLIETVPADEIERLSTGPRIE